MLKTNYFTTDSFHLNMVRNPWKLDFLCPKVYNEEGSKLGSTLYAVFKGPYSPSPSLPHLARLGRVRTWAPHHCL